MEYGLSTIIKYLNWSRKWASYYRGGSITDTIKAKVAGISKTVKWSVLLALLFIDALGLNLSSTIIKIEICDIAAWYNTIVAVCPPVVRIAQDLKWFFWIITVLWIVVLFYKPRLLLIKHVSFTMDVAPVEPSILKNYHVKTYEITQCDNMNSIATINDAITQVDEFSDNVLKKRKMAEFMYYGIAHTPLIFRLGFLIGDQNNVRLLHKKRSNNSLFDEWSKYDVHSTITHVEKNESIYSEEMIVAISTSFQIKVEELAWLQPESKHALFFESNHFSVDSILSYVQAENFRNFIMHAIRTSVKKYGIKKIHLAISSSVAFTFFLAQAFSAQHDPRVVVYHYDNGDYPWGICMKEKAESAVVINGDSVE